MASGLPPPPVNDQPGSFAWLEWYRQLRNYVSTSGSVPWYIINFSGSNLTDLATRLHNNLQGLQGGTSGEQYHLTAAQHAALIAGNHNDLSGLQGGTSTERYHLTATQHNDIINGVNKEGINYQTPTTGFSITIGNDDCNLILEPAGTLDTGTVVMPATPTDKQVVRISSTQVITALTVNANTGQTIKGAVTTLAANGFASWIYRSTNTTWYRIG